jgi:hypothetical protein
MQGRWFFLLMASICLEGLGRRYVPSVPSLAFYLLKDVVLLVGFLVYRPPRAVVTTVKQLFLGFGRIWAVACVFTVLQVFNPEHMSLPLAVIGLRAYWLWWLAPVVIAGVLATEKNRRQAIFILSALSLGISVLAAFQFASPPDSSLNLYSVVDGENVYADIATVASTGRARVASTFSYLSGFCDFALLVPALLLALGLEGTRDPRLRRLVLLATLACAAVVPMTGSRGTMIFGGVVLALTAWSAGLFFTPAGRRVMIGVIVGGILSVVAFPDAFLGVQSRFEGEDTDQRMHEALNFLPPVALAMYDFPAAGIGTGMQQNARASLRVYPSWASEAEPHRVLIELGIVGYFLMWMTKLGLVVALMRARKILKAGGRKASSGAALSYAAVTFVGSFAFDHVFQALYFVGCGFILAEVISVTRSAGLRPAMDFGRGGPQVALREP